MKAAQKNSLLNYFPKKECSDVESNAKKNGVEMVRTLKGGELVDSKEKKQNGTKEMEARENQISCTKGKPMLKGGGKSNKNVLKRKRKEVVDEQEDEGIFGGVLKRESQVLVL